MNTAVYYSKEVCRELLAGNNSLKLWLHYYKAQKSACSYMMHPVIHHLSIDQLLLCGHLYTCKCVNLVQCFLLKLQGGLPRLALLPLSSGNLHNSEQPGRMIHALTYMYV